MALERSTVRRACKPHPCGSYRCPNIMRECRHCLNARTGRTIVEVTRP